MHRTLDHAITFNPAVDKLTMRERRAVRQTEQEIQQNPEAPGLHREKYHPGVYTYRANRDIRIVGFEQGSSVTLLYVDHHDAANA